MVVGDDQINPQRSRIGRLFHRRDAVVHRDNQRIALFVNPVDGPLGQAVAVPLPAGQHTFHGAAQTLELFIEQGGGRHPIHIIVSVDHNGFALFQGLMNPGTGLVHVLHQEGIAEGVLSRQEGQRLLRLGQSPGCQQSRQQAGFFLLLGQHRRLFGVVPFLPQKGGLLFQLFGPFLGDGLLQAGHRLPVQRAKFPRTAGHRRPSPVRPSLASIPSSAAISLDTSSAASDNRVS